jgi:hypothetical protein
MADEEGDTNKPPDVWPKKGSFVFPNGARYGAPPHPAPPPHAISAR